MRFTLSVFLFLGAIFHFSCASKPEPNPPMIEEEINKYQNIGWYDNAKSELIPDKSPTQNGNDVYSHLRHSTKLENEEEVDSEDYEDYAEDSDEYDDEIEDEEHEEAEEDEEVQNSADVMESEDATPEDDYDVNDYIENGEDHIYDENFEDSDIYDDNDLENNSDPLKPNWRSSDDFNKDENHQIRLIGGRAARISNLKKMQSVRRYLHDLKKLFLQFFR